MGTIPSILPLLSKLFEKTVLDEKTALAKFQTDRRRPSIDSKHLNFFSEGSISVEIPISKIQSVCVMDTFINEPFTTLICCLVKLALGNFGFQPNSPNP